MPEKKPVRKLYSKTPFDASFEMVEGILNFAKMPLTQEQQFRLKSEALAFKSTLLYKLVSTYTADQMQKEIVDNCKNMEDLNYYRAVLADRRMLIEEIDAWAKSNVKIPKVGVDTGIQQGVQLQ